MPEPVILDTHSLIVRINENDIEPDILKSNLQRIATERPEDLPKVAEALASQMQNLKREVSKRKTITAIAGVTLAIVMLTGIGVSTVLAIRSASLAEQERIAREQAVQAERIAMELENEARKQEAIARKRIEEAQKRK